MSVSIESAPYHLAAGRMVMRDAAQQRIVNLVLVIYWLLILEGALRKWSLPQLEEVFFFVRVPVALALYLIAFHNRRWPRTSAPMLGFYLFAVAVTIVVPIQLVAGGYGQRYILLAGYGWVNYFFYMPLAFLIAEQFRREDLDRFTRHAAWLALAAAFVGVVLLVTLREVRTPGKTGVFPVSCLPDCVRRSVRKSALLGFRAEINILPRAFGTSVNEI